MLQDLETIHEKIINAHKAVMKLSGIDLDKIQMQGVPTKHAQYETIAQQCVQHRYAG
jgi:hypothetical protein